VHFVPWWSTAPTLVAEELLGVPDPLLTALRPGPSAPGREVACSLAQSLASPEHPDSPPSWLLPEQVPSFRRAVAGLRHYGGVVLADPVGSGKTYVALAVAAVLNRSSTACLVPATLLGQWKQAAARTKVPVSLCSHQQVSRGWLPQGTRGLVIIDESHHFRNQHTRRYQHLAPWLVGRPTLLISATPIVNRVADLAHQLALAVRDTALESSGIVSLRALLSTGSPTAALGQLIVERDLAPGPRPQRTQDLSEPSAAECADIGRLLPRLIRLRLSRHQPIAALIQMVLLRAVASSPAALEAVLRRYRRLLLHARDALNAGQVMDRAELRRLTGELGDQLIWWELLPAAGTESEIELTDLSELDELIRAAKTACATDDKVARLREVLRDGSPTLVFASSRDTVRYLRDQLGGPDLAWCTGERAGIGTGIVARRIVLDWFRHPTTSPHAPRHLLVTDVAAEGLDLQRAARVVHYDLPWNPMRLEQREGRAARYGSSHRNIEVVRFIPPPALERMLRLQATLARKARLPAAVGLGAGGDRVWRWRDRLADCFGKGFARSGVAQVAWSSPGLLAGFTISRVGDGGAPAPASVLWFEDDGSWTEDPAVIESRLDSAAAQDQIVSPSPIELRDWLSVLVRPIRERFSLLQGRRWATPDPTPAVRCLLDRLQRLVREAARSRQAKRLELLDQALAIVAGGHTAGEAILLEHLVELPDEMLEAAVGRFPRATSRWDALEVRLTGLILFGSNLENCAPTANRSLRP
jgi:superfamily II DNA or RNA helicase